MSDEQAPTAQPVPAVPSAPSAPRRSLARWITPALAIVAALAIGLFGGVVIGHNTAAAAQGRSDAFAARGQAPGNGGGGGFRRLGDFATGTIVSVADGTIVIRTAAGDRETITTTGKTTVTQTRKTSVGALRKGETITATGTKDANGNLSANTVSEVVPRGGFGRNAGATRTTPLPIAASPAG